MRNITENEMKTALLVLKNPKEYFNARTIGKSIGISHMGALKIVRKLEKEGIFSSKRIGKAITYQINFKKDYPKKYLQFLLQRESEYSHPYIKMWVNELKKVKISDVIILFGSVLTKHNLAKDIDVLFIINKKNFNNINKQIDAINLINQKKIHPIFQTEGDLKKNIKSEDKIILGAIRGVVVLGEDILIELIKK